MGTGVDTQVRNLPIFKHFNETEITGQIDSFRKGEKGLFSFVKLGALIGTGYLVWAYVLPTVFIMLGQMLAVALTGIFILGVIIALPVIVKGLRAFTRTLHKTLIKNDPFAELYRQKNLMVQNQQTFRVAKGKIQELKNDCEIESTKNAKDSEKLQTTILRLQEKSKKLKSDMDTLLSNNGVAAKSTDEYVNLNSELLKTVSEAQRVAAQLEQAKDFIQKYGSRAVIMSKFGQKLTMVETSMDIKVLDFDATIEILKKDYAFAEKSKNATEAAKSAMLFSKSWELEYAIDVVTNTISSDIAITSGNLKDIDSLTKNYAIDSDELFTNLDTLANNIKIGNDIIPDVKAYSNPDYVLSSTDRQKSGGFDNIF